MKSLFVEHTMASPGVSQMFPFTTLTLVFSTSTVKLSESLGGAAIRKNNGLISVPEFVRLLNCALIIYKTLC